VQLIPESVFIGDGRLLLHEFYDILEDLLHIVSVLYVI